MTTSKKLNLIVCASLFALLALIQVGAYPFPYQYPSYPAYYGGYGGYSGYGSQYSSFSPSVYQRNVYDIQDVNRYFTDYRPHLIQTLHHHYYRLNDYHNIVDTYSNQDIDVYHPMMYGGAYWNSNSYGTYNGGLVY